MGIGGCCCVEASFERRKILLCPGCTNLFFIEESDPCFALKSCEACAGDVGGWLTFDQTFVSSPAKPGSRSKSAISGMCLDAVHQFCEHSVCLCVRVCACVKTIHTR